MRVTLQALAAEAGPGQSLGVVGFDSLLYTEALERETDGQLFRTPSLCVCGN